MCGSECASACVRVRVRVNWRLKRYWPSFAAVKEPGACCGFCPTPEQVDEQPSLITYLQNHFTKSRWSWCATLRSTSHHSPEAPVRQASVFPHRTVIPSLSLLQTLLLTQNKPQVRHVSLYPLFFPVNWDTPLRSRKVKVNDFGGTDFLHCHIFKFWMDYNLESLQRAAPLQSLLSLALVNCNRIPL